MKKVRWTKPREVSGKDFDNLFQYYSDKADRKETDEAGPESFFSGSSSPCGMPSWLYINEDDTIYHYLPTPCSLITYDDIGKTNTICLCETSDGHYYIHRHKVGCCPWKEER